MGDPRPSGGRGPTGADEPACRRLHNPILGELLVALQGLEARREHAVRGKEIRNCLLVLAKQAALGLVFGRESSNARLKSSYYTGIRTGLGVSPHEQRAR
jgi:hypothetical protein